MGLRKTGAVHFNLHTVAAFIVTQDRTVDLVRFSFALHCAATGLWVVVAVHFLMYSSFHMKLPPDYGP